MIIITKLLNPKNDYVFKRIFGYTGNEKITQNFLSSIIPDNIKEIQINCNPVTEKDLLDDKIGILDIKAKLNNNINCNIEMQIVDKKDVEKRILFYWSKMYSSSIKAGGNYGNLERSIVILLTDYNLDNLKKIPEFLTKWNIREEKYPHLILTNALEIYIIELDKAKDFLNNSHTDLNSWLQFINNPEVKLSMENEEIKKAKQILEEISQDERERQLTELREKYILDQNATEAYGYDKGLAAGIEQGEKRKQLNIAKNMIEKGIDIETIIELTGITKEEIEKL